MDAPATPPACSDCGGPLPAGRACPSCAPDRDVWTTLKGLAILLGSFFAMPLETLAITLRQLRQVGTIGRLETERTEIPHLTWLGMAGHLLTSIVIVFVAGSGLLRGVLSLRDLRWSIADALVNFVLYPLAGVLFAILANWFMMITLEMLLVWAGIANDLKRIADRDGS